MKTEEEKSPLWVWARGLHKGRPKEKKEEKNGKGRKRKIFSPMTCGSNWTLLLSQMERRLFFVFWSIPKGPTPGKFPFRSRQSKAVSECSGTCKKLLSPCLHLGMGFLFCRSLQLERENCAEVSSAQVWERQQNLNGSSSIPKSPRKFRDGNLFFLACRGTLPLPVRQN